VPETLDRAEELLRTAGINSRASITAAKQPLPV
jgi:hypothetical protein